MKKFVFSILFLIAPGSFAWDQWAPLPINACNIQAPYGFPKASRGDLMGNSQAICRHAYATLHDNVAKIPVWVSYTLLPQNALGCVPRSNGFAADN